MRKFLAIVVLGLVLVGCASTTKFVNFDEIKKIEKENYIIVGFEGYQRDTDTIYKINEANYTGIEKSINGFCKAKGKNTYVGKSYWNNINYTYGNGIRVNGKKFWCAKSLDEAEKLFIDDLQNPTDQSLSINQEEFQKRSIQFLNQGRPEKIKSYIFNAKAAEDLKLYGKIHVEEKLVSAKKSGETNAKKSGETTAKTQGASGTAFFVSKNYLITNHHVIKSCNNNSKIIYQTKEIDAQLIAKDEFLDLALLKADVKNETYISISNNPPSKLQRIIAAGYPFGKYLSDDIKFTSGIISSLKGLGDDSTRLQIDAALNSGNSGGPIVDEKTGELVAVAVAGLRKDLTEAVNFGIKAGSVKNFLESNQIDVALQNKKYNSTSVAKLLEDATMYTFCK